LYSKGKEASEKSGALLFRSGEFILNRALKQEGIKHSEDMSSILFIEGLNTLDGISMGRYMRYKPVRK
ncbi:MAG: hypothetical protein ACJATI_005598, partial [Halioglobus sp.]